MIASRVSNARGENPLFSYSLQEAVLPGEKERRRERGGETEKEG